MASRLCRHGKNYCNECAEEDRTIINKKPTNIYTVVGKLDDPKTCLAVEAFWDNIVVRVDPYRSGYECKTCDGVCYLTEDCSWCKGSGKESDGSECRYCCKQTAVDKRMPGKQVCPDCKGKGGLITAPDDSETRPSTGVVTSIGPNVKFIQVGWRVVFTLFSGTGLDFRQGREGVVRMMHEHEVLGRVHGLMKVGERVR